MNTKASNLKRADFLSLCVIISVCLITMLHHFMGKAVSEGLNSSIPLFVAIVVAVILFFIPVPSTFKGITNSLIIFATAMIALTQDPTEQGILFAIAASIIILRLYYSSILILAYAVIVNGTFLVFYFLNVEAIFGQERPISYLITTLLMIDAVFAVLFFSNKWGNEVIVKASKKEKEVEELLTKIQSTFQKVEESSVVLNDNVATLDQNMDTIVKSSQETTRTMNEIAKGTENQAESIYSINSSMNEAIEEVNTTREISGKLTANSNLIAKKVSRGTEKINSMMDQMNTINQAVSAATTTVNELQTNIEHINSFLEGIAEISEQTNLLSLNAAIESARAGEQGKGFAVVAGEVGKLAVQSAQTAKNIQEIIGIISQNSATAVEKVGMGEKAVEVGNVVLGRVGDYFRDVETTIQETFDYLEKENTMINKVLDQFMQVQEKIESIAGISEEHTASNEEILATIENENNGIMAIKSSIEEIKKLSVVLNEMLHNE